PLVRSNAEQVSASDSFASNPDRIQKAPQAPYVSPYVFMDISFNKAVLQIRDSDTGDVMTQFPSRSRLESSRRAAADAGSSESASVAKAQPQASEDVSVAPAKANVTPQQIAAFDAASRAGAESGAGAAPSEVSVLA